MDTILPRSVAYRALAVAGQTLTGKLALKALPRVRQIAFEAPQNDDVAQVELEFYEDQQRRVRVQGQLQATIILQCQRCFKSTSCRIDSRFAGVIVTDDAAAAAVPHADEPILAQGDELQLYDFVEDEILLDLPMATRCTRKACEDSFDRQQPLASAEPEEPVEPVDHPFSVLEKLRNNKKG